ncbi:MAG: type II toxin-antitoxin system VapC family toxin [Candidatus Methanomethylicia archaeon]|nr:type II toxin-antitoxin system VapC family toxin [Candidatus Methanomethylicia archaeon]
MRVIDSSALVKYFSREVGWEKVGEVISEGVVTLDLAIKELSNALWKKVLRSEMNHEIAMRIIRDIVEGKPFPIETQERYLLDAFEIAVKSNVTVYDALFIAMAKRKSLELVTCDEKQAEITKKLGLKVVLI